MIREAVFSLGCLAGPPPLIIHPMYKKDPLEGRAWQPTQYFAWRIRGQGAIYIQSDTTDAISMHAHTVPNHSPGNSWLHISEKVVNNSYGNSNLWMGKKKIYWWLGTSPQKKVVFSFSVIFFLSTMSQLKKKKKKSTLFILFLVMLSFCCCVQTLSSSCSSTGLLSHCRAWASYLQWHSTAERWLCSCGSWA